MARFFKNILSSCLGTLLFFILLFLVFLIIGLASNSKPSYQKNTVLKADLNILIPEKSSNMDQFTALFDNKTMGLNDILELFERAKEDDKIEGILLNATFPQLGLANSLTLRKAIEDFKESGKFVYAYGDSYTQTGYYISSAADSVFLNPNGMLDIRGLSVSMPYFKEMMDELGITWNIYYAGQFKSATEPFRRKNMSDQNRLQMREFIDEVSDNLMLDIASSRKIPVEAVDRFAAEFAGFDPERSVSDGLVDELLYTDGLNSKIKSRMGLGEKEKVKFISLNKYQTVSKSKTSSKSKDKIAVVYAEGDIVDAGEERGMISGDKYVEMLSKIRKKKNIKAVVLRINSGGGSGFASDEIWREINLIKASGKPVIVSMGDYAASGGYYIACNADSIVASPNSLTGSIGVFAMMPNLKKFTNEKLKIHFDSVKTHPYANAFNPFFEFSDDEHDKLQKYIDKFYEQFLGRVAEGRNMSRDEVHAVAQGRIWTGRKAKELGLIDELGELEDAIAIAAEKADLESYKTTEYPKFKKTILDEVIKNMDLETRVPALKMVKSSQKLKPYSRLLLDEENYGEAQMLLPLRISVK
jgi:protease-4